MVSNSLLKPFALLLGLITPVLHSRLLQYLAQITAVLDGDYYSTWPKYWHCSDHLLTQLLFKTLAYNWVSYYKKNAYDISVVDITI